MPSTSSDSSFDNSNLQLKDLVDDKYDAESDDEIIGDFYDYEQQL